MDSNSGGAPDGPGGLRARYPGVLIWRGRFTHTLWAMHPHGGELINADDEDELAGKLGAGWTS